MDNSPLLISADFTEFTTTWQFAHVKTFLYHSQSNGKAVSLNKIAKNIIKKSLRDKKGLWLSFLDWRDAPTECKNTSRVQRLFSRHTKTVLPTNFDLLIP